MQFVLLATHPQKGLQFLLSREIIIGGCSISS